MRRLVGRLGTRGRQTLSAGAGTLLGNVSGVVLPFAITVVYGSGRVTDGYFLAAASANFVVILMVAVESVCVPYYAKVRADDGAGGAELAGRLLRRSFAAAAALVALAYTATALVVVPHGGLTGPERHRVLVLLLVLAPLPVVAALSSVLASAHYAYGRFGLPTATQALRSAAALVCVLGGELGLPLVVAAAALSVGELARAAVLLARLPCPRPTVADVVHGGPLDGYWSTALPSVLSMLIVGVNPVIDKAVAAGTGPSGITTLELAEKLFYVPTILFGGMIASVLSSEWASVYVRTGSRRAVAPQFWRAQRVVLGAAAGLTAVAVLAVVAVGPAAGRAVGLHDGARFAEVLALYLVGLPAAFFIEVSGRLITTLRVNKVLPWVSGLALVLNLVLDLAGRAVLGLSGIALSTSLVRTSAALVMAWWVVRQFARDPVPVPTAGASAA